MPSPDSIEAPDAAAGRDPDGPAADSQSRAQPDDRSSETDPRLHEGYVRRLPDHDLTLVGVVHDHPASVHRARAVVRERDPATVALEAPPLAVPLYRAYARGSRTPPTFGGEMSAAAQAARECDADVVGVDAPTADFFARLARNCWAERASLDTLRRVASGVTSVTRHAVVCRAAAAVADRSALRVEVDDPIDHDCDRSDPPEVQARDERRQARRSQSLLRAFDPPRPVQLRDETREECMADRLGSLGDGETVAILGLDHLDGVATLLAEK